jgi:predicted ABC-type ATPase
VIAGLNGAGSSTAAPHLPIQVLGILEFVNTDKIVAGLSTYIPETVTFEARSIMLQRLRTLTKARVSLSFETTPSSRNFALFSGALENTGLPSPRLQLALLNTELAILRVPYASNWTDTTSRSKTSLTVSSIAFTTYSRCICRLQTAGPC